MLNIIVNSLNKNLENEISMVSGYFDAQYETSWSNSKLAKEIIKDIDDTEYVKDAYLQSPLLGAISPRDLSTGCKATLLLLNEDDIIVRGERFGDNCAKWILKVADIKDVTITLNHVLKFPEPFKIKCINTGKILTTYKDYINELVDIATSED